MTSFIKPEHKRLLKDLENGSAQQATTAAKKLIYDLALEPGGLYLKCNMAPAADTRRGIVHGIK